MQLSVKFMLVATLGFALPTPVQAGSRELLANRNIVEHIAALTCNRTVVSLAARSLPAGDQWDDLRL